MNYFRENGGISRVKGDLYRLLFPSVRFNSCKLAPDACFYSNLNSQIVKQVKQHEV